MKVKARGNSSTPEHHQHQYNASELWKLDACFACGHIDTCLHRTRLQYIHAYTWTHVCTRLHRTRLHRTHAQDACFVQDTCFALGNTYPWFAQGHRAACLQWIHVYTRTHVLHRAYAQDACFAHGHTHVYTGQVHRTRFAPDAFFARDARFADASTHTPRRDGRSPVAATAESGRKDSASGNHAKAAGTTIPGSVASGRRASQRRLAPPSGPAQPGPGPSAQSSRAAAGEPHGAPGGGRLLPGRRWYVRAPRKAGRGRRAGSRGWLRIRWPAPGRWWRAPRWLRGRGCLAGWAAVRPGLQWCRASQTGSHVWCLVPGQRTAGLQSVGLARCGVSQPQTHRTPRALGKVRGACRTVAQWRGRAWETLTVLPLGAAGES